MDKLQELFQLEQHHFSVTRLIVGCGIIVVVLVIRKIFDAIIIKKLVHWSEKTKFKYDDLMIKAIQKPFSVYLLFLGFYLAIKAIDLPESKDFQVNAFLAQTYKVTVATMMVWCIYRLTDVFSHFLYQRFAGKDVVMEKQFLPLLRRSLRIFVVVIGVLLIVQNMGYSVGSLLAGLGIGGLAVALAAQETLANIFSSFMLLTDMPFRVGDWILFRDVEGVVENIGFRTTRIRSFNKSLYTVPNKLLTNDPIENFTTRDRRRIKMNLGITYDTPVAKVEKFVREIKSLVENNSDLRQDFHLVHFTEFKDSSLNILVYCFTTTTDWAKYMTIQENLNLEIMRKAEELGVEFAFPSQSLYWGNGQSPIKA